MVVAMLCRCFSKGSGKSSTEAMPASPFAEVAHNDHFAATGPSEEAFANPMLLDDEETILTAERLREELSAASHPVLADPLSAVVNTSIFGQERGRSYSSAAFQRLDSQMPQRLDSQLPKRLDSQLPKQGAPFLNWTQSRKLLEAAIAAEQQSIPEEVEAPPAAGRPLAEWQEVEAAEQRLQKKLGKFRLDMYVMEGDGNCQFRAVSFGLYGKQDYHGYVRQKALEYMRGHKHDFEAFLGEDVGVYLQQMSQQGVWGDELTLRATCDAFGVVINVITSDAENWFLRYLPQQKAAVRHEVFLTYIAPIHYNAIRRHSASLNSHTFMKKHSQILRAVNEYEKRHVIPDNPERLTELVGKV